MIQEVGRGSGHLAVHEHLWASLPPEAAPRIFEPGHATPHKMSVCRVSVKINSLLPFANPPSSSGVGQATSACFDPIATREAASNTRGSSGSWTKAQHAMLGSGYTVEIGHDLVETLLLGNLTETRVWAMTPRTSTRSSSPRGVAKFLTRRLSARTRNDK